MRVYGLGFRKGSLYEVSYASTKDTVVINFIINSLIVILSVMATMIVVGILITGI